MYSQLRALSSSRGMGVLLEVGRVRAAEVRHDVARLRAVELHVLGLEELVSRSLTDGQVHAHPDAVAGVTGVPAVHDAPAVAHPAVALAVPLRERDRGKR